MGSGNSRLGSHQCRTRVNSRRSKLLSSFLCGGSTSRSTIEIEDCSDENLLNSVERCHPTVDAIHNVSRGSSLISRTGTRNNSGSTETGTSSGGCILLNEDSCVRDVNGNFERIDNDKCLAKSKELVFPHNQVSADSSHYEFYRNRNGTTPASASFREQESSDLSVNIPPNENAVNGIEHSANRGESQRLGDSHLDVISEATAIRDSHPDSSAHVSDSPAAFDSSGDESIRGAMPAGLGFIVSNREPGQVDGSLVHVDLVGISSSNILSNGNVDTSSNHEPRRNGRRMLWDAFSRRGSRRFISNSPTIVFSASHDSDDLASQDRWLLDFGSDFFDDGVGGDSGYLGSRIHSLNEQRRQSRSEIWERLRGGLDENGRRTTICPSGLHPDGACSCDSFLSEESNTRAISRIVMLAEALFEVLDEIHRQPVSLSLSMVSAPAPESVVDLFPLKNHKKKDIAESRDDIEQCYICLAEYEDGDKIRVLPCHHEYHMSCVDKWLKEIHGVCPLCRRDVRQGAVECESSNSEILSIS